VAVRRRTAGFALFLALLRSVAAGSQDPSPSLRDRVRRLAEASLESRCLTPAIGAVFNQAVESGALRAALGSSFTITDVSASDRRIELTVAKSGGAGHTVTLALGRIVGRAPDGQAGDFVFYLQPGADAESSGVLLGLGRVLAERVPESAFAPCRSREEAFGSRAVALWSAALAVLVVIVALTFGFWTLDHRTTAQCEMRHPGV
jgi:hypothetical protein